MPISSPTSSPRSLRQDHRAGSKGRLLLITYHFPPSREVGAVRWQQLAKFAVERGWSVDVVTLDSANVAMPDGEALAGLPREVRVFGVPQYALPLDRAVQRLIALRRSLRLVRRGADTGARAPEAARPVSIRLADLKSPLHSPRDAVRAFHGWREYARSTVWSRRAEGIARGLLASAKYRVLVTCGPPHWVHAVGVRLHRRWRLPLVIDMRDPWSQTPRLQEPVASRLWLDVARRHERRMVAEAALLVANTEPFRRAMQEAYPHARDRIITVMNGYDDEPVPPPDHGGCLVIGYAGSIYLDRDPRPLLRAAARVIRERNLTPEQLRLEFMGSEATLAQMAADEHIATFVRVHGPGPRPDARRFLARIALLVSFTSVADARDPDPFIPAKIFEYARFHAWLLALTHPGSATAAVLSDTGADVVDPDDVDAIAAVIGRHYTAFTRGIRPQPLRLPGRLSRKAQAQLLFDEMERRLPASQDPDE